MGMVCKEGEIRLHPCLAGGEQLPEVMELHKMKSISDGLPKRQAPIEVAELNNLEYIGHELRL